MKKKIRRLLRTIKDECLGLIGSISNSIDLPLNLRCFLWILLRDYFRFCVNLQTGVE